MMELRHDIRALLGVFRSLSEGLGGAVELIVRKAAERAEALLSERAPRRTGRMIESVGSVVHGRTAIVGLRAHYARFLELGTRPHEIRPRRAKALRFPLGGRIVFASRVEHPGIRPRRFVRAVAEELVERMGSIFEGAMEHVI